MSNTLDAQLEEAWDDVSGAQLDPKEVRRARMEEIEYIHKIYFYTKVFISQCHQRTNKGSISVRWIDINKGDVERPNYRSRLVAREINTYKRDDLFAATLPLEAMKLILSMAASNTLGKVLMVNDASSTFFHARATREVYVQLPEEDHKPDGEKLCGRLNYSMHGTRDAAMNWQAEYSQRLIDNGFQRKNRRIVLTCVQTDNATNCSNNCNVKILEQPRHCDEILDALLALNQQCHETTKRLPKNQVPINYTKQMSLPHCFQTNA